MTQVSQTRSLPMAQWCAMASEGAAPPVTIPLEGDSMRPLIRRGSDLVTIVPISGPIRKGEVVLFHLGERYIVHRVWKLQTGQVQTFGDNCRAPDPWIPETQVLGQVICYQRNGRIHRLDTPAARAWGRIWMALHPLRRCLKSLRALAGRCYRKCLPDAEGR